MDGRHFGEIILAGIIGNAIGGIVGEVVGNVLGIGTPQVQMDAGQSSFKASELGQATAPQETIERSFYLNDLARYRGNPNVEVLNIMVTPREQLSIVTGEIVCAWCWSDRSILIQGLTKW